MKVLFLFVLLSSSSVMAQTGITNEGPVSNIECSASHNDLEASFESHLTKAKLTIRNADGKSYVCTGKPTYVDGKAFANPIYRVTLSIHDSCTPKLPMSLARTIRTDVRFEMQIYSKKSYLDWVSYSKPASCEPKINNLEDYFKSKTLIPATSLR